MSPSAATAPLRLPPALLKQADAFALGSRGVSGLDEARVLLRAAVAEPHLITGLPLRRKAGGYERTLLLGDSERSVWAFVWEPGAGTAIHDHHCSCCFAVLAGELMERWFTATSDTQARVTQEQRRAAGFMACLLPSGPNIHQMVNRGNKAAISLHVYGFDPSQRASSVEREYSLAAQ